MAASADYSDLMENRSSLHLHEGFMAVLVYSEPRQNEAGGIKAMGLKNEVERKAWLWHVETRRGISQTGILGRQRLA